MEGFIVKPKNNISKKEVFPPPAAKKVTEMLGIHKEPFYFKIKIKRKK